MVTLSVMTLSLMSLSLTTASMMAHHTLGLTIGDHISDALIRDTVCASQVPRDTPGLTIGRKEDKLGIRASSTCEVPAAADSDASSLELSSNPPFTWRRRRARCRPQRAMSM